MGEVKEFKSFYKEVKGNEGNKCNYPIRLDTYGCGCTHDCNYCYAKSLLEFRGLWDALNPSVADIDKIKRKIAKIPEGTIIRLGGMTDCFMSIEQNMRVTYRTLLELNKRRIGYLIVTKSDLVASDDYMDVLDKDLAHIQITVTCTDDELYKSLNYEKAPLPSKRIRAIERLYDAGYDVQLRLSPFIPQFIDLDVLSDIRCDKLLIEFLRVNTWVRRWFNIDFSDYTVKQSGYNHLPLEKKKEYINMLMSRDSHGTSRLITVCEDETEAYNYWREHFNPDKEDCCNLRK